MPTGHVELKNVGASGVKPCQQAATLPPITLSDDSITVLKSLWR